MASSFADQIPTIVHLLQALQPRTMLDVGKGFGKYGFLTHEYVGIPTDRRPTPGVVFRAQSSVSIDAVEVQADYDWPHLSQLYRNIKVGDITELYPSLRGYDVVLMADVIEHIPKSDGTGVLRHFVDDGSAVIVSTPKTFFAQDLYDSPHEAHVSHWRPRDFRFAAHLAWQTVGAGRIYLLSGAPRRVRGFGNDPLTRARRIARAFASELPILRCSPGVRFGSRAGSGQRSTTDRLSERSADGFPGRCPSIRRPWIAAKCRR